MLLLTFDADGLGKGLPFFILDTYDLGKELPFFILADD